LPVPVIADAPVSLALRLAATIELAGTAFRALSGLVSMRIGAWKEWIRAMSRPRGRVLLLPAP
jgi:hypothetical protein